MTRAIDRREAIRQAGLVAGVVFAPAWLRIFDVEPVAGQTGQPARHLWAVPFATVSAIADRILPPTDTPGAVDVGVPDFIDRLYADFMAPAERQMFTSGLEAVDAAATASHRLPFRSLPAAQQDEVLRAMAKAEEAQPQGFFRMFRSATILGYFTSERVGRTVLNYDPVPGRYDACVPIDQIGNRNWTS
jgi:hypothetical protein